LSNNAGQCNISDISVSGTYVPIFGDASSILAARIGNITYRTAPPALQKLSWTPVVKCGSTTQTGTWTGFYTVQNNTCTAYFSLAFSGGAPAGGNLTIEGLPYQAGSGSYVAGGRSSGLAYYTGMASIVGHPHFNVSLGTRIIDCYHGSGTGSTALAHGNLNNTTILIGSVSFPIIT